MEQSLAVLVGIDGGGTHTRVLVTDLQGQVLAYLEKGAASLRKDAQATRNVQTAILEALAQAGRQPGHVAGLAAGIAGYDGEEDLAWVEPLTELKGLTGPRWHVNDAVVAHYGALRGRPGIVTISGTGAIILAITEQGRVLRNYDFHHYSASAARYLSYDAVYEALAGKADKSDAALLEQMLAHWEVPSLAAFHELAAGGFENDRRERDRRFGQFAPMVTEAACQGSELAIRVCQQAIDKVRIGIELLGAAFSAEAVPVALIGSVSRSLYFTEELGRILPHGANRRYEVVEPAFPPVIGAILLAMERLQLEVTETALSNLKLAALRPEGVPLEQV